MEAMRVYSQNAFLGISSSQIPRCQQDALDYILGLYPLLLFHLCQKNNVNPHFSTIGNFHV